mgnify:CR=1 FL=1
MHYINGIYFFIPVLWRNPPADIAISRSKYLDKEQGFINKIYLFFRLRTCGFHFGHTLKAIVINVSAKDRKIGLSVKTLEDEGEAEAVEKIPDVAPDVVLLDMRMPRMNGLEVLRRLRASGQRMQVAILTNRIRYLTDHLKQHKKDFHTRRGLIMLVNKRAKQLRYLQKRAIGTELKRNCVNASLAEHLRFTWSTTWSI